MCGYSSPVTGDEGFVYFLDVDECSTGVASCHKDALCINTAGLSFCVCKDGFIGDGENSCVRGMSVYSVELFW